MAMTFTPAVCGGRQFRFWLHVFLFWAGAMIGAVATGLAAYGAVQQLRLVLPHGAVAGVAVGLMGVCIARDLGARVWVPYRKQQVPEWLRKMVPTSVSAFAYGAMIGLGFATRYTYSAHSAMVVGAAFLNLPAIIALAATFAAGKSVAEPPPRSERLCRRWDMPSMSASSSVDTGRTRCELRASYSAPPLPSPSSHHREVRNADAKTTSHGHLCGRCRTRSSCTHRNPAWLGQPCLSWRTVHPGQLAIRQSRSRCPTAG